MVDYKHKDLFLSMDSDKQIKIAFSGGIITNSDMQQGSFNLSESLCSESNLRFGSCEASILKFRVHNVFSPLKGETLTVSEILDGLTDEPFSYGTYKVDSDKATVDRKYRDVVAYDSMYDILNADVAEWYNGFFPEKSESEVGEGKEEEEIVLTLKDFRNSFFEHLGIEQEEITLANDGMVVEKTVEPEQLSGKQVINAICEINGCFGHIGRDGKFKYVHLKTGEEWLFPSANLYPSENLFPKEGDSYLLNTSRYIPPTTYEDYVTEKITGIVIRQEENDVGGQVGEMDNAYVIQDNFLVYGKGNEQLLTIGSNILSVIKDISYRPFSTKAKGNPCIEVGDAIRLNSKTQRIDSYVLQRTLTGVKNLRDEYSADGEKKQPTEVNSLSRSIQQIKGKTNELTRTVEETKSSIKDVESGLSSEITQTASQIRTELQNTKEGLESSITQTASQIRSEVSDSDKNLQSQITQNAGNITSEITRATNAENALSTRITQTDEKIRSDVKATYETIKVVEEKTNAAKESANTYTDTKLALYSTTEQMNSSIEQTASSITSSVDAKIAQTVTYIDTKAATAESNAKNDTANKLKSYSTTTEMNTAITQKADSITAEVNKQITETKTYADNAAATAETNAKADTTERLKSYSTTQEVESKISLSETGILQTVSSTYATKSEFDTTTANLQQQIDGAIETYTGSEVPTLSNSPASGWTTNEIKDTHIGDLYVVNSSGGDYAGFYYRFEKNGSVYQWTLLKDNEVTKALQDAKEANDKADAISENLVENYSTTKEVTTAIEQSESKINLSVDSKIKETKTYADTQATAAKDSANATTTEKLKSYSTTTQVESKISASEEKITLAYESRVTRAETYADSKAYNAESNAKADTTEKLKSYSTTTEVESKIEASKDGILLSVSNTYETSANASKEYESIKASIKVNADNIALKVGSGDVQTMINASLDSLVLSSSQIKLEGYTTINGGFAIDTNGNAILKSGSMEAYLSSSYFTIGSTESGNSGTTLISGKSIFVNNIGIVSTLDDGTVQVSAPKVYSGGYLVITTATIGDYTSNFATSTELDNLETSISRNYATVIDLDNVWSAIDDLRDRVSALE